MINQINLFDQRIKKSFLYLGWILLILLLFFRGCGNSETGTTSVTIPAITKTLPADTIVKHQVLEVKKMVRDRKTENKYLKDISEAEQRIIAYQEEIDNMQSEFMWGDSIKQAELYRLATELKSFETELEDEYLKLKINGIIAGNEVKEITPTYTIKKREVNVPKKETKFRMLGGVGIGNTLMFNKPIFNANVGFQNKKGNILTIGYDTETRILLGYNFSIFKIDK